MKKPTEEATEQEYNDFLQEVIDETSKMLSAANFHYDAIIEETDKSIVEVHIQALEYIFECDIHHAIKNGFGELINIREKCIKMGLI